MATNDPALRALYGLWKPEPVQDDECHCTVCMLVRELKEANAPRKTSAEGLETVDVARWEDDGGRVEGTRH